MDYELKAETKINVYRKIYNEVKNDPDVLDVGYPKEKEDNCHITTSPKSSYTSALDCHTQLGSEGNVDLALYYQNNVITESEFSLLKKESIYTINDVHAFLNNMIGHLTYLKHKVGERDFNALLMVLYKIKDYKFSKHQPQRKSENIFWETVRI